jgi:hypothetical protein
MSGIDIHAADAPRSVRVGGERSSIAAAVIKGLALAAAPTFAIMAVLTAMTGGNAGMICSAAHGAGPLGGMVPMYALMSAFHAAPWLRRIFGR